MADVLLDDVITTSVLLRDATRRDVPVEPPADPPPILVCRGPHAGTCTLLERNGIEGLVGGDHGLVVEVDPSIPAHRHALQTLRTSLPEGTALVVLPRVGNRNATAC